MDHICRLRAVDYQYIKYKSNILGEIEGMYRVVSFVCLLTLIVSLSLVATQETVLGYTGKEIVIKLENAQSYSVNGTNNNQIKVNVSFSVSDSTLIGQKINAVMKVHSSNGSVIKTTSFPTGFIANKTDTTQLLTNIPKALAQNTTTETVFTDLNKTNILSNIVKTLPALSGSVKSSDFTPTVLANKT
jgi:hypothetical protein